jgi:hypothetical protein
MTLENSIEEMKCLLQSRDNGSVQCFEVCLLQRDAVNCSLGGEQESILSRCTFLGSL